MYCRLNWSIPLRHFKIFQFIHTKHYNIVCTTPISAGGLRRWGGWVNILPNFQKGGLHKVSIFRGGLLGMRVMTFFKGWGWGRGKGREKGVCAVLYIKNKLKSEIFNDKKILKRRLFFSVISKNFNSEILTKNLVTFKRWDGVKDEKF